MLLLYQGQVHREREMFFSLKFDKNKQSIIILAFVIFEIMEETNCSLQQNVVQKEKEFRK